MLGLATLCFCASYIQRIVGRRDALLTLVVGLVFMIGGFIALYQSI